MDSLIKSVLGGDEKPKPDDIEQAFIDFLQTRQFINTPWTVVAKISWYDGVALGREYTRNCLLEFLQDRATTLEARIKGSKEPYLPQAIIEHHDEVLYLIANLKVLWGRSTLTTTVHIGGTTRTGKSEAALLLASQIESMDITHMLDDIFGERT